MEMEAPALPQTLVLPTRPGFARPHPSPTHISIDGKVAGEEAARHLRRWGSPARANIDGC